MNTTYKPRIASPYQAPKKDPYDITAKNHPVRQEVQKCIGKYDLTAIFEEDVRTVDTLRIPGLIAFTCTIKNGDKVMGIGRGNAVISKVNKYVERTVHTAFNYSLIDAISKTTRIFDALYVNQNSQPQEKEVVLADAYKTRDSYGVEPITEKQKTYLLELIHTNIRNEDERILRESQIDEFTKEEASRAIQSFQK